MHVATVSDDGCQELPGALHYVDNVLWVDEQHPCGPLSLVLLMTPLEQTLVVGCGQEQSNSVSWKIYLVHETSLPSNLALHIHVESYNSIIAYSLTSQRQCFSEGINTLLGIMVI